jgi:ABC-type polysaccharide/polyol phosphate transport system ATPase subunit
MSHILLKNVDVHYPVLNDHYMSLRRAALRVLTGGRLYREDNQMQLVHALKDISLEVKNGDRLALVGRNGAGKSTLLKTLAGFILPDKGGFEIEGKVTSLFSAGGGLDGERTGIDNILVMGRLLGISRPEMEKHIPDIAEFSELGAFLNLPVRSYSDGMKIRLGFAIVTCLHPDILVLDEAIGAGDAHFIEKATLRATKLYERANIIVIASHDPTILKRLCNRAVWLDQGRVLRDGSVTEILDEYTRATV